MARKRKGKSALVLVAGGKPQQRKASRRDWTKEKEAKFLSVLADTTSYSVSFAVALSSRPIKAVGRIWADGKLIRDSDGAFTVGTSFRFHDGSEDQAIDPLIGSAEGIANTPAYRGLAVAMFENLELGEFGNRIPFLTFEVVGDLAAPAVGTMVNDAAKGSIACSAADLVEGYAAYGRSIRSAIEPLIECFGVELFDDGWNLRCPTMGTPLAIDQSEFGNSADAEHQPLVQREQTPASALPLALRLSYYDPARDFQAGEARASVADRTGTETRQELPAVLPADSAKSLAQQILARRWAERDRLTLRLPPRHLVLQPGSILALPLAPANWIVEQCTTDGFVVVADLKPSWKPGVTLPGDAGRIAPNAAVGTADISLALFDIPQLVDQSSTQPTLVLAASSTSPGWKSSGVEVIAASQSSLVRTAARKTVLGGALTLLGSGQSYLMDELGSVDVEFVDADQWLVSCDDEALVNGTNLAVLGSELIQFGEAIAIGPGRFRLRRLLRGRGGTEWAAGAHSAGEAFALIEADAIRTVELPDWVIGSQVSATAVGSASAAGAATITASGESLRPPAPVRLRASFTAGGDLGLSWIRRSRRGWAWIDEIDAPLGESLEAYRITVAGSLGSIEVSSSGTALTIPASDLASIGPGAASIEVRQIGDWAASRPAQRTIIIA